MQLPDDGRQYPTEYPGLADYHLKYFVWKNLDKSSFTLSQAQL